MMQSGACALGKHAVCNLAGCGCLCHSKTKQVFIVGWSGDCQIEAETPEDAIEELKKNGELVVTCSLFKARQKEK